VASAWLLTACGGSSRTPDATLTPAARVAGSACFVDRDHDQLVGAGDTVTVRFDQPVTVRQSAVAFQLPVDGDSFGSGARMEDGDRVDEVRIVLGIGARLRAGGRHAGLGAGSPSGLALPTTAAIVDRSRQAPVAADAARDLAAGFSVQPAPGLADDAEAIAAGDLDGDGDLDVVVGRDGGSAKVLTNQGAWTFTDSGQTLGAGGSLALGDVDGDGDLDVVVGSNDTVTSVWRNDGAGLFQLLQNLPAADTECVALGDLDRDGDLDLVRGNGASDADSIWWNDGTGQFAAGPSVGAGNTRTVTIADVDGDGDLDLLQGRAGPSRIWQNDGAGAFTAGQAIGSGNTHSIAAGDLDCDGDVDLVTAGRDPSEVWRNDGAAGFTPTGGLSNAATDAVRLVDVDGDGRLDVYAANANGQDDELWLVDANLVLRWSGTSYANGTTTDAAVGDFDRDGDLDVVTVGPGDGLRLMVGSTAASHGPLAFQAGDAQLGEGAALHVAAADLDRDGDADVVESMGDVRATAVWRNDGAANFPTRSLLATGGLAAALGDVDRDGDIDLLETSPTAGLRLWRNDGTGPAGSAESLSTIGGLGLALHDVDRDGDLDLLLARGLAGAAELWRNDGTGAFTAVAVPLLPTGANAAVIVDLDRDGDADLLLATDQGLVLLANDGSGAFPTALTIGTAALHTLATGDVDGDGDVDLAVGGAGGHAIWRNDGSGAFDTSPALAGTAVHALAVADLDADGDLDLLRGGTGPDQLWTNAGGTFTLTTVALSAGPTTAFAIADLDCDGDADLVVADGSAAGGLRVYVRD
jgi:hypothetical protein